MRCSEVKALIIGLVEKGKVMDIANTHIIDQEEKKFKYIVILIVF